MHGHVALEALKQRTVTRNSILVGYGMCLACVLQDSHVRVE
jgi:hypothetical protein